MHGITRSAITKAQGGRWSSGFWSGFAASGFAAPKSWGLEVGTVTTAIVSGTVSKVSGGKFSNGAVTGAFVHMFNHMANGYITDEQQKVCREMTFSERIDYETWANSVDKPLVDSSDLLFGFGTAKLFKSGMEMTISKNLRIAPLGNRTGHNYGRFLHYHRRGLDFNGITKPGQGIGRHRSLEIKSTDKSFWDRF